MDEICAEPILQKNLEPRDLDLAQSLAEKACELAEHKDASILDVLTIQRQAD